MDQNKKEQLENKGFQVSDTKTFLGSSDNEMQEINDRIAQEDELKNSIKKMRERYGPILITLSQKNRDYFTELINNHGENLILVNGKPIGHCECKGFGKESCKGNGWQKITVGVDDNHRPTYDFVNCPHFKNLEK